MQLLPVSRTTQGLQAHLAGVNATISEAFGDAELVFVATLPPLGYSTFFLQPSDSCGAAATAPCGGAGGDASSALADAQRLHGGAAPAAALVALQGRVDSSNGGRELLENGLVTLEFDSESGE